jgi:hypothetical protein
MLTPFNIGQIVCIGWFLMATAAAVIWPRFLPPSTWVTVGFTVPYFALTIGKLLS